MSEPACATLSELAAEPERVADAALSGPLRIERDGGADLVLLSAEAFERLRGPQLEATLVSDMSDGEIEEMLAQETPGEASRHDDEGGFVGHG